MSKMLTSGPTSNLPKFWWMLVSNSKSSSPNRIHCRMLTKPSLFSTTFSDNNYCKQQQLLLQQQQPSSSSIPYPPKPIPQTATQKGVPASIYASSSQFEQQQFGRQPQAGAFGWFDPEYDGDENREEQDEEAEDFEDEDEPEIPKALRQAFLKQQAQAAADLEASLNMAMPGSLNVSPSPPATAAPATQAAATPSGWGVKNAAKAVVNGLGNSKALPTPAPAQVDGRRK